MTEILDFTVMAKMVSQAAGRALGLLIAKYKTLGGMPFDVYNKLYDALVWPVIAYGADVWGDRPYSCIEAIQNQAMRFYLGVSRYTPSAGVAGDMGWTPTFIRQWKSVLPNSRINKRIFMYAYQKSNNRCKNWPFRFKTHLNAINCSLFDTVEQPINERNMIEQVTNSMKSIHVIKWAEIVNNDRGVSGRGGNKLRKSRYETETYCKTIMSSTHRSAMAKFRTGVAPLRIETGRYEGLPEAERTCIFCKDHVEDEIHALFDYHLYNEIRLELFQYAQYVNHHFNSLTKLDKFVFLFCSPKMVRSCAKACFLILQRRAAFLTR